MARLFITHRRFDCWHLVLLAVPARHTECCALDDICPTHPRVAQEGIEVAVRELRLLWGALSAIEPSGRAPICPEANSRRASPGTVAACQYALLGVTPGGSHLSTDRAGDAAPTFAAITSTSTMTSPGISTPTATDAGTPSPATVATTAA
jgi:hypothetical protein